MEYGKRIRYAAMCSACIHFGGLALAAHRTPAASLGASPRDDPIVIALRTPEPKQIQRLIETREATGGAIGETDLISDKASKARDNSDVEGDTEQPYFEEASEFDELGEIPVEVPPAQTEALPLPSSSEAFEKELERESPVTRSGPTEEATKIEADAVALLPEPDPAPEELPEPFEVAQAQPEPERLAQNLHVARGREGGGVSLDGIASFEANRHALGAYMLEVRKHVEREWRLGLQLRYSGVSRAYAVLVCSITPEGKLERVEIVDPGQSPTYALMCKNAVENAAHFFRPFPFDVPEIYRQKNLEIRWKFTYM
ncbi:MAG: hypothetical protein IID08_04575 [Candidatus Hydrogenedentes bacterium]|nr:hypothetical protein [Candidatus Hydrogenedentota bacterium]